MSYLVALQIIVSARNASTRKCSQCVILCEYSQYEILEYAAQSSSSSNGSILAVGTLIYCEYPQYENTVNTQYWRYVVVWPSVHTWYCGYLQYSNKLNYKVV